MFPPIQTGTSFYSKNLAGILDQQGHNITLITVENSDNIEDNYLYEVIRIKAFHINVKNYFKHLRFSSFYLSNYKKIKNIAKARNSDVILLVNHYLDIAFPAIYAAKSLNLPLFVSVGTQLQSLNYFRNKILRFSDRVICGRLIFPYCKNIISWDSEIERYIYEVQRMKNARKSVIIPFGANVNNEGIASIVPEYSLKNTIVGVGAIISQRDYSFHIKVLKELLKHKPGIRLKIIGHIYSDVAIKLANELGVADKVQFLGELPHDQVLSEMKNADIHWMMLCGKYVGLGTASLEAMLLGIPIISNAPSNLFGKAELKDMETYVYTDGIDISSITSKIINILSDQNLKRKIGERGKDFIQQNLNWNDVGKQMTKLFETSLKNN
jgi:glycosyltransferase involved in cell wall biosynthesis